MHEWPIYFAKTSFYHFYRCNICQIDIVFLQWTPCKWFIQHYVMFNLKLHRYYFRTIICSNEKKAGSFTKDYSESLQKTMKTRPDLMYLDYSLHCFKFKFTLQILVFQKGFLRAFVGSHASDEENRTRQKYSWSELLHKLMEIFSYIFHVIMKVGYVCHRMHFCQRVRY